MSILKDYLFYQDDWATIYCGDCLEIMPLMEGGSDLCLTDFPYANQTNYECYVDNANNLNVLIEKSLPLILGLSSRALIACGVSNVHYYPKPNWILCWAIQAATGSSCWGFACWQPILAYGPDPYLKGRLGRRPDTFFFNGRSEKNGHPCPKPLPLWEWLIKRGSLSGDIFDPFLGSGTTCVAARNLNRKSIGIEINPKYCEIAVKRLRQEVFDFRTPETQQGVIQCQN
jgi:DNA modification methylase